MASTRLDSPLIARAVEALLNYEGKRASESGKESLVGSYSKPIVAQVQLKKEISKPVVKPVRVKIPYSLFSPGADQNDDTVCLFCRSEDKDAIEAFLALNPIDGLKTVISINLLKKNYNRLDDKKKLLKEHTHFLCDCRIVSQLYSLLGKTFLSKHSNSPVPIEYKNVHGVPAAVMQSVSSSYMHLKGSVISIRLGTTIMSSKHVTQNVEQGLAFAINKLHGQWKDVSCIHIKISDSAALPIYTKVQSEAHLFLKKQVDADTADTESSGSNKKKNKAKNSGNKTPNSIKTSRAADSTVEKDASSGTKKKAPTTAEKPSGKAPMTGEKATSKSTPGSAGSAVSALSSGSSTQKASAKPTSAAKAQGKGSKVAKVVKVAKVAKAKK